MNIKKIVSLSVSFVLLVFSFIFNAPDSKAVTAGAGNGTSEAIEEVGDLSEIITSLPSANDYYSGLVDEENENFKSLTYVETGRITNEVKSGSRTEKEELDRTLTICYTLEGAYYHVDGTQTITSTVLKNNGQEVASKLETVLTFDYEIYISSEAVFVKYNKWEIAETSTDKDYEPDENQAYVQKLIQDNYGKWIDFTYKFEEDFEFPEEIPTDPDEMEEIGNAYLEFMKKQICSEVSKLYIEQLITINDKNATFLGTLGLYLATGIDSFDKTGNIYILSDKETFTATIGAPVESFYVNMGNPKMIIMHYNSGYLGSSLAEVTMIFKNVGNTVISVPKKTHMNVYDLFSPLIEKMMGMEESE